MMTLLTCQCDSVMKKMCGILFPAVQKTSEPATNCSDVQIAQTICCAFIIIALIFVFGALVWKWLEGYAVKKEREFKKKKEEEENKQKLQMDMVNRYLDFLDNCAKGKEYIVPNSEKPDTDSTKIENYRKVLQYVTQQVVNNKLNEFSAKNIENIIVGKKGFPEEEPKEDEVKNHEN